jgi:hypothetical protein
LGHDEKTLISTALATAGALTGTLASNLALAGKPTVSEIDKDVRSKMDRSPEQSVVVVVVVVVGHGPARPIRCGHSC